MIGRRCEITWRMGAVEPVQTRRKYARQASLNCLRYILFGQIIRIVIKGPIIYEVSTEEKVKSFAGLIVYLFGIKSYSRVGTIKLAAL